jgi:hypothetical protein
MVESTEPRLTPRGYKRDHMRTILGMNDRCSRWLVPVALLTTLFASSRTWALNSRDFGSTRHGTTERVFELPLSSGEAQRVLYLSPDSPRATIIMLPGGTGNIGLARDGNLRHGENFVVRTRGIWVATGYAVVIPDTIDHANLRGVRSSAEYASVVEALIRFAHTQSQGPVFLLGTSQGSIAAANGAAHAGPGMLAGVVLTESVSRLGGSHETVFDTGLQNIRIPALVVANRNDRCDVAPPQDAPKIAAAMSHSPSVRLVQVSGGIIASSNSCASLTPHGYYGMELQIVGTVSDWIRNPPP